MRILATLLTPLAVIVLLGAGDAAPAHASGGSITTFAGTAAGDGTPATAASLHSPDGIVADAAGDIYIADTLNCRVRKLSGSTISTVAGVGVCRTSGDGGPATSAEVRLPTDIAFGPSGEMYIMSNAPQGVAASRMVSGGTISTPDPTFGGHSVAVHPNGDQYFAGGCGVGRRSGSTQTIVAGDDDGACGYGGDGGPATAALLNDTDGLAFDAAGDLYIADTMNCRIRKLSGGIITTVAGNGVCATAGDGGPAGSASINKPDGVAIDPSNGDLYIAETGGGRIRRVSGGTITTFAGGGPCCLGDGGAATSAFLWDPADVAVTPSGDVYVGETTPCRLRKITGGIITTAAGSTSPAGTGVCSFSGDGTPATNAALRSPRDVHIAASGDVYIADRDNCRVRRVTAGIITTVAGSVLCGYSGDGGAATAARLNLPIAVVTDGVGDLYIADSVNCRIRRVSAGTISTFAGNGVCGYGGDGGMPGAAMISNSVSGLAVDVSGALYIADTGNCRVRRVFGGSIDTVAGNGACAGPSGDGGDPLLAVLRAPHDVVFDAGGALHIAERDRCSIRKVAGGVITTVAGTGVCGVRGLGGPAADAQILAPHSLAFAPDGSLYLTIENPPGSGCHLQRITPLGTLHTLAVCNPPSEPGPLVLRGMEAVAVDPAGLPHVVETFSFYTQRVLIIGPPSDADGDGIGDNVDNCPADANPGQENADREFIDQRPPKTQDDYSRANADRLGDACDPDMDNDGLANAVEAVACGSGSAPTDPLKHDTDGDHVLDGAECALGSDPANAAVRPPAIVAPDADADGLPDPLDPNDGDKDADNDGIRDGIEFRGYNTSASSENTDSGLSSDDGGCDGMEMASVDGNFVVNSADLGLVASGFGTYGSPPLPADLWRENMDTDKNGAVNAADLGLVAKFFSVSCAPS